MNDPAARAEWIRRCSATLVECSPIDLPLQHAEDLAAELWRDTHGAVAPEAAAWLEIDSWPADEPARQRAPRA